MIGTPAGMSKILKWRCEDAPAAMLMGCRAVEFATSMQPQLPGFPQFVVHCRLENGLGFANRVLQDCRRCVQQFDGSAVASRTWICFGMLAVTWIAMGCLSYCDILVLAISKNPNPGMWILVGSPGMSKYQNDGMQGFVIF